MLYIRYFLKKRGKYICKLVVGIFTDDFKITWFFGDLWKLIPSSFPFRLWKPGWFWMLKRSRHAKIFWSYYGYCINPGCAYRFYHLFSIVLQSPLAHLLINVTNIYWNLTNIKHALHYQMLMFNFQINYSGSAGKLNLYHNS